MKQTTWEVLLPARPQISYKLSEQEEEQLLLSLYGRSRRSIIGSHLEIRKKKGEEFWKLYTVFQDKKHTLLTERKNAETVDLTVNAGHETGPREKGREFNRAELLSKAYAKYERKFRKLIGKAQSARLMQLELQLDCGIWSVMHQREGMKG